MKHSKKKYCFHSTLVTMLVTLIWSGHSNAQEVGSVFIGANNALKEVLLDNNFNIYKVNDLGVIFGFMLPIRTGQIDIYYKARVGLNGIEDILSSSKPSTDDGQFYRNLDHYVSALNEVLVGRRIDLSSRTYIRPFFGLGFLLHLLYGNKGPGFAYGTFQVGVIAQVMYNLDSFELGTMLSFDYIPFDGYLNSTSERYISIAIILSK